MFVKLTTAKFLKMVFKINHPECLHAHLCFLMYSVSIQRQIYISTKAINLLVFMVFSMMWGATIYSKTLPFPVIILGLLVILTLGYISVAQTRHIKQLGDMITHLCTVYG